MKLFHKVFLFTVCLLMTISCLTFKVVGEETGFYVADVSSGKIEKVESFVDGYSANYFYMNNVENYDNLVLFENDVVLKMEYGVVEFVTNKDGDLNIAYQSLSKGTESAINGSYGIDAAYLYSNFEGNLVYFKVAGDLGYTSFEDVILHPYELLDNRISAYENFNGDFCHLINRRFEDDYKYVLSIDKALDYLEENKPYYSFDGHYFYESFKTMIDDYTNNTYENSINSENPYYNYYEYLPFRSLTNYDYQEIEDYFYKTLGIKDKIYYYDDQNFDGANDVVNRSQYYDELKSFIEYQNMYGANALLLLSLSANESSWGKSYDAFTKNNLFLDVAYKNDEERNNKRYSCLADSILAFSKYYVSDLYANYRNAKYYGNFVGNKLSGINASYRYDAYWGEKVASNYYMIDKALGFKDRDSYCLGVIKGNKRVDFYNDSSLGEKKYTQLGIDDYSLVILEDWGDSYKVQIDPSFNSDYLYDFNECVAYVDKDNFSFLLNEDSIHQNQMVTVTFDLIGETINGSNNFSMKVLKGTSPVFNQVSNDGKVLSFFESKIGPVNEDTTYKARYKEIKEIEIKKSFKTNVELGSYLDLRDSKLLVKYKDHSSDEISINTNMIGNIDTNEDGEKTLKVSYHGISEEVNVNVSKQEKDNKDEIARLIDSNIVSYIENGSYSSSDIKKIKNNISKYDYDYNYYKIRQIDAILLGEYRDRVNYRVDDNDFDLSVSGLTLSLADANITSLFKPFKDTYYVHIKDVANGNKKELEDVAKAYGFSPTLFINVNYSLNMKKIEQNGATIISLKIDDKKPNAIYSVYRLDDNGDIVKCQTIHTSNSINFVTKKSGDFVILEKDSVNNYLIDDNFENISMANSDPDNHKLFIMGELLMVVIVLGLVVIVLYYRTENKRKELWKDYKKSLQKAESAQEEKPKN